MAAAVLAFEFFLLCANSNSMAFAVIALYALGIDSTSRLNKGMPNPMKGLVSFADESLSGFKHGDNLNDLSAEQCFRALVATCAGKDFWQRKLERIRSKYDLRLQD